MDVTVTFRHVSPSVVLRRYAESKVARLDRFIHKPVQAHVILCVEKQRHTAEIQISGHQLHVTAKNITADLYAAIDGSIDKVEQQLRKHVTKHRRGKGEISTAHALDEAPAKVPALRPRKTVVRAMAVDEARTTLETTEVSFVLFRNTANDSVYLMYRRTDGQLALLAPEL